MSDNIPESLKIKYIEVTAITDDVCKKYISDEFASIVRKATSALCCLPDSPINKGAVKAWACGITHAIGMVNFLYDNHQKPYLAAHDLYKSFGVSSSTAQIKSKIARDILNMTQMDISWSIQDRINDNSSTWFFDINGRLIDIRKMPITLQRSFFEKGYIPFIPGDRLPIAH